MEETRISEIFVKNLLAVMPGWHSKLVRPFKEKLSREMSLETYYCLETLRVCGTVTMTELARRLKIPKQQVTKLVDKLEEHRFIERIAKADDRRSVCIRLTPSAITYLDEYYVKNTAFIRTLEDQLTEEEIIQLDEAVRTLGRILPKLH